MECGKKEIYTTFEAAEIARVHHETIKNWIRAGILKAYKTPGGHHRIEHHHLVEFLNQNGIPFSVPVRRTGGPGERIKVLLVDDDLALLEAIKSYVASAPEISTRYEIEYVSSSFEAGMKVAQFAPRVVVIDIVMPGMDGFKVVEVLRAQKTNGSVSLVCLTGYPEEANVQRMKELGVHHIFAKPIEIGRLFKEIELVLVPA